MSNGLKIVNKHAKAALIAGSVVLPWIFIGTPALAQAQVTPRDLYTSSLQHGLVLRTGNRLNLFVKQGASSLAAMAVDCDGDKGKLLFTEQNGKRAYPLPGMSTDPANTYHPPSDLPAATVASLKAAVPLVHEACASIKPPDWRVIASTSGYMALLDVANLMPSDSQISAWVAYDYPQIAQDPPYQAPYGQKREWVQIDCRAKTWAIKAGYDLDETETVTDAAFFPAASLEAPGKDDQVVVDTICNADKRNQLPAFSPRHKAAQAAGGDALVADPAVLASIRAADLPHAAKSLSHYVVDGTSAFLGRTNQPTHEEVSLASDPSTGLTRISKQGLHYKMQVLDLMGFLDVALVSHAGQVWMSDVAKQVQFHGDWKDMKVGETFGFSFVHSMTSNVTAVVGQSDAACECTVEGEVPASTLHASLTGTAKKLSCERTASKHPNAATIEQGYFLRDYGWYIPLKEASKGHFESDLTLIDVQ